MPDEPRAPLHYTVKGDSAACGARFLVGGGTFSASFDEDDIDINCPLCRMYIKGLRAGRNGA